MKIRKIRKHLLNRRAVLPAAVILVAASALELTNTIDFINRTSEPSSVTTPNQPSENKETPASSTERTPTPTDSKTAKDVNPSGVSSQNLQSPEKSTYVSNHNPDSRDSSLQSVCITTPGAKCTMVFTKGSVSKSLSSKTVDDSGAAIWSWTPDEIGLTSGSWSITAKATLGNQTKTSKDVIALRVP